MRVFLAIDIENYLKNDILETQEILKSTDSARIKLVEEDNIHLTMKFFGDVTDTKLEEIMDTIDYVKDEYDPYNMKLSRVGAFPNIKRPRVIWIGCHDKEKMTSDLMQNLDFNFEKIGFDLERSYTPHITIGRVKQTYDDNRLRELLKDIESTYYGDMEVHKLTLKSSELTPNGPIYDTIEEFSLM
ncbi:MAG: RNA 2',3'-cyclic phosphodiesterase [Methanosphaera sp.]|nr:RNA 2',3'-cyclic phosphodiesterase [Methanosphaera sp.]